jgi:hypothetical protein
MRLLMSVASAMLLAVATNGCSDSIGPESIVGWWGLNGSLPGNSQDMFLALDGSTVSGTGIWCGEALGCGSTSVTGTASGNRIHLVTTFSNGRVQTFDGTLVSLNSLVGGATENPTPSTALLYSASFRRLTEDPPRTQ